MFARACVRACVLACVCVCVCACVRACVRAGSHLKHKHVLRNRTISLIFCSCLSNITYFQLVTASSYPYPYAMSPVRARYLPSMQHDSFWRTKPPNQNNLSLTSSSISLPLTSRSAFRSRSPETLIYSE